MPVPPSDANDPGTPPHSVDMGAGKPADGVSGPSLNGGGNGTGLDRPGRPSSSPAEALPLLRMFCEELLAEAQIAAGESVQSGPAPGVDWSRVWASGWTAALETAAGRAAVASQSIAREIVEHRTEAPDPVGHPAPARVDDRSVLAPSLPTPPVPPPISSIGALGALGADASVPPSSLTTELPVVPDVAAGPEQDHGLESEPADAVDPSSAHYRRLRNVFVAFGWVRNVGVILLLFAAWQLWGTSIEQGHAQRSLGQDFQTEVHHAPARPPGGQLLVSANTRLPDPPQGSAVGRLQIPSIGLDQYVVEGTAAADLAKGPGHYTGTSQPGQAGNVAIAGHRTTYGAPFNHLDELRINDRIILTADDGQRLTYVVSQEPVAVTPRDVSILNTGSDNRLTLTTCNPKFSASQRLVVVALLSEPQAAVSTPVKPKIVQPLADATGWNMGFLPVALLIIAFLVLLGLVNERASRVYGRTGRWLVLGPIWVAGLYFLFVFLTKLLPANL